MENKVIANFVKEMRKKYNLTQVDLSDKSGVGLRFVRDLEQGKQTLRMDKLNQVLNLFGKQLGAVDISKDNP
jgi:y4mF family transcriptional regulator